MYKRQHGKGGYLNVRHLDKPNGLNNIYLEAAKSLQYLENEDFNGAIQEGVGFYQSTTTKGRRHSAATAFLSPAVKNRKNLKIITQAPVFKLLLEGERVIGVSIQSELKNREVFAGKEVILSAGSKGQRAALPHSSIVLHQPRSGASGQATDIQIRAKEVIHNKQTMLKILSKNTGKTVAQLSKDSDRMSYLNPIEAVELKNLGEKVILVRDETSPDAIHGMHASQGILTAKGGMTSHAALVARGWGKCCIVGLSLIHI